MSGLVLPDIIARTNSTVFTRLSINFSFGRWGEDDRAVVEDTVIGRVYEEMMHGEDKWLWLLQQIPEAGPGRPIPPPKERPTAWTSE